MFPCYLDQDELQYFQPFCDTSKQPSNQLPLYQIQFSLPCIAQIIAEFISLIRLSIYNSVFISTKIFQSKGKTFFHYYLGKVIREDFRRIQVKQWRREVQNLGKELLNILSKSVNQYKTNKQQQQWRSWLKGIYESVDYNQINLQQQISAVINNMHYLTVYQNNHLPTKIFNGLISRRLLYQSILEQRLLHNIKQSSVNHNEETFLSIFIFLQQAQKYNLIANLQQQQDQEETTYINLGVCKKKKITFIIWLQKFSQFYEQNQNTTQEIIKKGRLRYLKVQVKYEIYPKQTLIEFTTVPFFKLDLKSVGKIQKMWIQVQFDWSKLLNLQHLKGTAIDIFSMKLKYCADQGIQLTENIKMAKSQSILAVILEIIDKHALFWLIFSPYMSIEYIESEKKTRQHIYLQKSHLNILLSKLVKYSIYLINILEEIVKRSSKA